MKTATGRSLCLRCGFRPYSARPRREGQLPAPAARFLNLGLWLRRLHEALVLNAGRAVPIFYEAKFVVKEAELFALGQIDRLGLFRVSLCLDFDQSFAKTFLHSRQQPIVLGKAVKEECHFTIETHTRGMDIRALTSQELGLKQDLVDVVHRDARKHRGERIGAGSSSEIDAFQNVGKQCQESGVSHVPADNGQNVLTSVCIVFLDRDGVNARQALADDSRRPRDRICGASVGKTRSKA